ncbi:hypothetical protein [Pararhodospirillum oryzae]|uniref:Uncharacterized protein n=1 Tax=Pararhodospirillum oryzae TaxID=478448 RepID=A0A512H4S7_9PROT|nr:hypothetical protein [Pararhodospirillum oryzae]GEO80443.1 hypothetical protein ROR02_05740 [Pararhodospirillum oryzae]
MSFLSTLVAARAPLVWFGAGTLARQALGPVREARWEITASPRVRWVEDGTGALVPAREDTLARRLDLVFLAQGWSAPVVRAFLQADALPDGTLAPFTAPRALEGSAEVRVGQGVGGAVGLIGRARLAPREGAWPLGEEGWLGLALRLTLWPPFEPLSLPGLHSE